MTTSPSRDAAALTQLLEKWRDIWLLATSIAVLEWDEETRMPPAAAPHRSEQLALLAGIQHDRILDPALSELADALGDHPQAKAARIAIARRVRIPRALVVEEKLACVAAQQSWLEAREHNDFALFAPSLARVIALKREVSRCLVGDDGDPWEPHLQEHEPGASAKDVSALLLRLGTALRARMEASLGGEAPLDVVVGPGEKAGVIGLCVQLLGYDVDRGGFGENVHPFCATLGPDDVRIALRPSADSGDALPDLLGYVMHEIGHALYEQGVPADLVATPAGELRSTSLHESQSRLWENEVGKSRAFWTHFLPRLTRFVPGIPASARVDDIVKELKRARPGVIRVGADPTTYSLHILVRVELERALLEGRLAVHDLPRAWADAYEAQLAVRPDNDVDGVLQDGHWATGMFGYFPTYVIGNVVAAQLMAAARRSLPALDDDLAHGRTAPLRSWLAQHVYQRAGLATLNEIVRDATGSDVNEAAFLQSLA